MNKRLLFSLMSMMAIISMLLAACRPAPAPTEALRLCRPKPDP